MSISLLSLSLLNLLKSHIPPMLAPEQIGLAPPDAAQGRFLLGLHLYHVGEDPDFRVTGRIAVDSNVMQMPPMCLELRYMVTSFAGAPSDALDDHRILERVIGIMRDNPTLEPYSPLQPEVVPQTKIEFITMGADEAAKIWMFGGMAQKLSLHYRLSPVPIGSDIQSVVTRVKSADFAFSEGETDGGG